MHLSWPQGVGGLDKVSVSLPLSLSLSLSPRPCVLRESGMWGLAVQVVV